MQSVIARKQDCGFSSFARTAWDECKIFPKYNLQDEKAEGKCEEERIIDALLGDEE